MTTTTPTAQHLFAIVTAAGQLHTIDPDGVPIEAVRELARHACHVHETGASPWPAIDAATDFLRRYFADGYTDDAPPALPHWHRLACLEVVRAAANAAGHGDDDAPRWHSMTAGQLADELTYLADHQG